MRRKIPVVHKIVTPRPAPGPHLHLLGDFALTDGRAPVQVRPGGRRLLALLAGDRQPVARMSASAVLWPDSAPVQAAANLRATVSRLPRPGGASLVARVNDGIALADCVQVDVWRCEDEMRRLRSPSMPPVADGWSEQLSALLGGDLLPLWDEDWVLIQRERHRQARLHALERLGAALCEAGRWEEALQAGLAAVAGEPLRESAHRLVIEIHLAEGNPAEALRQFGIYRQLLWNELGLRPSDGLHAVLHAFLGRCGTTPGVRREAPGTPRA